MGSVTPGVFPAPECGQVEANVLPVGEVAQHPEGDVEVVACVRQGAQGLVERPEEVVPMGEDDPTCPDRLHRLGPVIADVALVQDAELADSEVGDIGAVAVERAGHVAGAALEQGGASGGVFDKDRPGVAALVGRGLDRVARRAR